MPLAWVLGQNGSGQNGTDKMVWTIYVIIIIKNIYMLFKYVLKSMASSRNTVT